MEERQNKLVPPRWHSLVKVPSNKNQLSPKAYLTISKTLSKCSAFYTWSGSSPSLWTLRHGCFNQLEGLVTKQNCLEMFLYLMQRSTMLQWYSTIIHVLDLNDFWTCTILTQDNPSQVADLVTWNKINFSVPSDTPESLSVSILYVVPVHLINCKGGPPWQVLFRPARATKLFSGYCFSHFASFWKYPETNQKIKLGVCLNVTECTCRLHWNINRWTLQDTSGLLSADGKKGRL